MTRWLGVLVLLACASTGLTESGGDMAELEVDALPLTPPVVDRAPLTTVASALVPPPIPSSQLKPPIIVDPRQAPNPQSIEDLQRLTQVVAREPVAATDLGQAGLDAQMDALAGIAQDDPALGLTQADIQAVIQREDATAKAMEARSLNGDSAALASAAASGDLATLTSAENRLATAVASTAPGSDERAKVQAEIANLERLIGEANKIQSELPSKQARLSALKKLWAEKYDEGKLAKDETLVETTQRLLKEVTQKIEDMKKKLSELEASKVKLEETLGKQQSQVVADQKAVAKDVAAIEKSPTPALIAEAERLGVHVNLKRIQHKLKQHHAKSHDSEDDEEDN